MAAFLSITTVAVETVQWAWSDGVGGAFWLLPDVALEALITDWMFPVNTNMMHCNVKGKSISYFLKLLWNDVKSTWLISDTYWLPYLVFLNLSRLYCMCCCSSVCTAEMTSLRVLYVSCGSSITNVEYSSCSGPSYTDLLPHASGWREETRYSTDASRLQPHHAYSNVQ